MSRRSKRRENDLLSLRAKKERKLNEAEVDRVKWPRDKISTRRPVTASTLIQQHRCISSQNAVSYSIEEYKDLLKSVYLISNCLAQHLTPNTELTASLSSLGKVCWMRLEYDVVRFTIIPDQGTQVWAQIPVVCDYDHL